MLTITYQVVPRTGGTAIATNTIFQSTDDKPPEWLEKLPKPQQEDPIELWSPLFGDEGHVIHVTGLVSYRHVHPDVINTLMHQQSVDAAMRQKEEATQYPEARYDWVVRTEYRRFRRVPKTDEHYQAQLREVLNNA